MSPVAFTAAGGSRPRNNLPPYLAVTFIIALEGVFPSRS
jgi:microcystin-dependent protein